MAARRYLLDTNIASYIVRGPGRDLAAKLVAVPMAQLCMSAVTEGELRYGLAKKPHAVALKTVVEEFLKRVEVLPWDSAAASSYGALRARLDAAGTPLGNLDTLIAAHALSIDAILVTNDRAFERVPALAVENWQSGPPAVA